MKKFLCLLSSLLLVASCAACFAEGKEPSQQTYANEAIVVSDSGVAFRAMPLSHAEDFFFLLPFLRGAFLFCPAASGIPRRFLGKKARSSARGQSASLAFLALPCYYCKQKPLRRGKGGDCRVRNEKAFRSFL